MDKVKASLASHADFSNNVQLMCSYMMETRPTVPEANKLINDAKTAWDKSVNDEQTIEKKVKDWTTKNRNWLRNKRKEKKKDTVQPEKTTDSWGKARWFETFTRELKPDRNLKNDGDLTEMRAWKQSIIRYTNYIRTTDFEMGPELYFDIFSNLCDKDMRLKLESIKGVRQLGEEKLWEIIESIYQETNPTYMRKIKRWR